MSAAGAVTLASADTMRIVASDPSGADAFVSAGNGAMTFTQKGTQKDTNIGQFLKD